MPKKTKFTRIPKVNELIDRGVPTEAIPTYCALSDEERMLLLDRIKRFRQGKA